MKPPRIPPPWIELALALFYTAAAVGLVVWWLIKVKPIL